nr:hypothetical protein [Tanacetum cinerariifolium]
MMIKCISELEQIIVNLIQDNKHLKERLDSHGARLYTLENLDIPQQVSKAVDEIVTDAVDWAIQALLWNRFRDLPEADMKVILHQRMWETNSYKAHKDHMMLYKALEKLMNRDHANELLKDLTEARRKKKKRRDSSKIPPEGQSHGSTVLSSSKTATSAEYTAWTTTNTRLNPFVSSIPKDLHMDDDMAPDAQAHSSDDEDIGNAYIPKVNLQQDWWKPLEEDRPATPEPAWSIPSSDMHVPTNNWASALTSTYTPLPEDSLLYQMEECHKLLTDSVDESIIRHNVSKQLLLGGLPSQVTIQSNFFFNKDLEYLRYGRKGGRPALSISKMKAAYYPDVGLEQMVPDQMWIDEECKHTSEGDRRAVRTYMRILSVVRIEVFSLYGYDYMKKIVLRRADLNEHIIAKRDFKYLYPSNFEDLDKYGVQMIMRFNEIHKFSDGTLHQIDEALDYRVKEFKVTKDEGNDGVEVSCV